MNLTIAAALCRQFEGFRSRPYRCPAGIPTIGYGTTFYPDGRGVEMDDSEITPEAGEVFLLHEIEKRCAPAVMRYCPVLLEPGNESRFNAIADFVYNLGPGRLQTSTLRRKINEKDWGASGDELMKWVRGGGRVLPGLVKRREAEVAMGFL